MSKEANLWERVRTGLAPYGHLSRVENGVTDAGTPDVNYCFEGVEGWIELKHGAKPHRPGTVVFASQAGMRPEQVRWISRRVGAGGRVWVLVQVGDCLFLVEGRLVALVNLQTFGGMVALAVWYHRGAMTKDDWNRLAGLLVG